MLETILTVMRNMIDYCLSVCCLEKKECSDQNA